MTEDQNQNISSQMIEETKTERKKKNKKYTKRIELRISEEEEKVLLKNCKKWELDKSSYIRIMCCTHEDTHKKINRNEIKEEINNLRNDLRRIGINLNQIARKLNQNNDSVKQEIFKKIYQDPYTDLLKKITDIVKDK